jgi:hypothetical protein
MWNLDFFEDVEVERELCGKRKGIRGRGRGTRESSGK